MLVGRPAAAYVEDASGAERAFLGREPSHQCGDFVDLTGAPDGDALNHIRYLFGREFIQDASVHDGRRYAVDAYSGLGEFLAD